MKKADHLLTHFEPEHYDLAFNLQRITRKFNGKVVISGRRTNNNAPIKLHAKDLEIQKVLVNDLPADVVFGSNDEITIIPGSEPAQLELTLTLEFSGNITDSMHGIYPCYYTHQGVAKEVLATQFESHHAREAFPCIDEPAAKATFNLTLETEKDVTSLSNMPIAEHSTQNDRQIIRFQTTPRMSTYLLAFASGELHSVSNKTKDGVEVNIWSTYNQKKEDLMFSLNIATRSIEFFNDYFKTPYPLPKADHIALPDFGGGAAAAMENWGIITYREDYLIADKNTAVSTKQSIGSTIAHETSHQWFGNLVTMQWWDDLWLNESFANMMQYAAIDALFPEWHIWTEFTSHESLAALRRDSLPRVQPVKQAVHHPDEISTLFDPAIVYAKGGQLLNMVRHFIGEDAFRSGLSHYFKTYAYQNTRGDDLWRALSEASGKDINSFMKKWLEYSGYPIVKATIRDKELTLSQHHFQIGATPSQRLWDIPLHSSDPILPTLLTTRSLKAKVSALPLKLNSKDISYFITHYDETLYTQLMSNLPDLTEIDRLQLLNEATLLSRGDIISGARLIDMLLAYKDETSQPVWDAIALVIADVKRLIEGNEKATTQFKKFVQNLAQPLYLTLGWHSLDKEDEHITKLRSMIISLMLYAEDSDAITEALKRYDAAKDIADIDGNTRTAILTAAVKHGKNHTQVVNDLLAYHHQTTSSDLQGDISVALTSTKNHKTIRHLLKIAQEDTKVRKQDFPHWFVYLIRNYEGRNITWKWLIEHWDWIVESYSSDMSYDLFPRYAASALSTEAELKNYKDFFEPLRSDLKIQRAIDVGIHEITSRVVWVQKNQPAVVRKLSELES